MTQLKNKTILITGGASGIGKIMSRLALERKAKIIIWDISKENIDQTLNDLSSLGDITAFQIDVTKTNKLKPLAEQIIAEHGKIDVLINNAGIVVGKYFNQHTSDDIDKSIQINTTAPMHIANKFLTSMIEKNSGHICNIASSAALVANPKMSVYAASKWALFAWSDSLRLEMKQLGRAVRITTILPYYINTGMFNGVKSKIPILNAEYAALTIIKAIEKNKKIITIPGWVYRFTRFGQAFMSINFFDWFADKIMGIYKTMENFKGRK